jgi:hypothetical protein
MYLKNKRTGTITEVTNPDVIRTLAVDKRYILADTIEELTGEVKSEPVQPDDEPVEEKPADEPADEPEKAEEPVKADKVDCSAMTLKELRAAAKKAGVPGYTNMDKTTLKAILEMR